MCVGTHQYAREVVCQVGDLHQGQTYRDPQARTWMVIDQKVSQTTGDKDHDATHKMVVCIEDSGDPFSDKKGEVTSVLNTVKLGYDRTGRLYAGRYLNGIKGKKQPPMGWADDDGPLPVDAVIQIVEDDNDELPF